MKFKYNDTPPNACCANHDSLEETSRILTYTGGKDFNGVGFLNDRKFKIDKSKKIITASNNPANDIYPSEFINPQIYGYTGDYAMFGESEAIGSEAVPLSVEKEDDRFNYSEYTKDPNVDGSDIKNIPLSDHQYIVSKIPMDKLEVEVENVMGELQTINNRLSYKDIKNMAATAAPKGTSSKKKIQKINPTSSKANSAENAKKKKNEKIKSIRRRN